MLYNPIAHQPATQAARNMLAVDLLRRTDPENEKQNELPVSNGIYLPRQRRTLSTDRRSKFSKTALRYNTARVKLPKHQPIKLFPTTLVVLEYWNEMARQTKGR